MPNGRENKFNNLDDEDMFVTLDLDDGSSMECQILTIFEADGRDYIALLPVDEDSDQMRTAKYLSTAILRMQREILPWRILRMTRSTKSYLTASMNCLTRQNLKI